MERLHSIGADLTDHAFRIENWEIARKDGGVFLHFSYIPKSVEDEVGSESGEVPSESSPGRLFIPRLVESARKHGGIPSWLGQWWVNRWEGRGRRGGSPGHRIYYAGLRTTSTIGQEDEESLLRGGESGMSETEAMAGGGRVWLVKGRQWTEVS